MAVVIDGDIGITASGNVSGNNMSTSSSGSYKSGSALAAPIFKDSNGTEIGTLCRAWASISGAVTPVITRGFNISSLTYTATGRWTVNFTNALPSATYSGYVTLDGNYNVTGGITGSATTTTCNIYVTTGGGAGYNPGALYIAFFA
jgi:hypothetical protein